MEFAFFWFCIEAMFAESLEDLLDMLLVGGLVRGIDKDVIQVDDNTTSKRSAKTVLTNRWNAAGAFIRPNGMTSHS